jgi:hypothetical protein
MSDSFVFKNPLNRLSCSEWSGGTASFGGGLFGHLSYPLDFSSQGSLFFLLRRKVSLFLISSIEDSS